MGDNVLSSSTPLTLTLAQSLTRRRKSDRLVTRLRQPTVVSPRLYRSWVHPWLRWKHRGLRRMEVYFPYFAMRVRFDDRRLGPGPPVEGYFHRLVRYAQAAGWGRR